MKSLIGLPGTTEFQVGFLVGLAGLIATILFRRRRLDWGIVWSICALAGLVRTDMFAEGRPVRALDFEPWLLLAGLGLSVAAFGVARGRARPQLALGFAASLFGVWGTVPDTEAISVLLGVTIAMIWSWWPLRLASPGLVGASVSVAIATFATIIGGMAREGAMAGGFGILAVLGMLGLLGRWFGRSSAPLDIGLHLLLVALWAVAARLQSEAISVVVSGTVVTGVVMGLAWLAARWTRPSPNQLENSADDPFPARSIE